MMMKEKRGKKYMRIYVNFTNYDPIHGYCFSAGNLVRKKGVGGPISCYECMSFIFHTSHGG